MIIYTTRKTAERFKLKMPDEFSDPFMRILVQEVCRRERGDRLLEWGAKIFYFDHRKCIQVCNFATKLKIILVDIKVDDTSEIANIIANYLFDIYSDNKEMTKLLKLFFSEFPVGCFSRLTDRGMITTLNSFQTYDLLDGYILYDYIENGILQTRKLNRILNKDRMVRLKINGKVDYYFPAEMFEKLLKKRYEHKPTKGNSTKRPFRLLS